MSNDFGVAEHRILAPLSAPDELGRVFNGDGVLVGDAGLYEQIPPKLRDSAGLLVQDEHGKWSAA